MIRFFCCRLPTLFIAHFAFLSNVFFHLANFYGQQFPLPSSAEFGPPQPLLYAKTLWPFPSPFATSNLDPAIAYQCLYGQNDHQNTAAGAYAPIEQPPQRPLYQNAPIWPFPKQRQNQPMELNDLIAQLSLSIVRTLAKLLAEREMGAEGKGIGAVPRHETKMDNGYESHFGGRTTETEQQPNETGNRKIHQFENAPTQSLQSTKYDYGLKAGLFVGHYGTSESIVSPLGPYGPLNSQIGGSYGGLSRWPFVFGRDLRRPQPSKSANAAVGIQSTQSLPMTERQRQTKQTQNRKGISGSDFTTPSQAKGEGTVVQIPLGENVQGEEEWREKEIVEKK